MNRCVSTLVELGVVLASLRTGWKWLMQRKRGRAALELPEESHPQHSMVIVDEHGREFEHRFPHRASLR